MKKLLFLLIPFFTSCEKVLFEEDLASSDPFKNFDYLWNECNEKYAYFEYKNVDWDSIYVAYRQKLYVGMFNDSLFKVLGGMLTELKDDHTNLISGFNISFFGTTYLGQDNFDWRIIVDNYITQDFYISGPFRHSFIANNRVGYVRFASFTGGVSDGNLNFVLSRYQDTEGIIFDLRENGGGAVSDIFTLLSHLIDQETLVNYSRIKNGPGRNDFSDLEPVYVSPSDGIRYTKPIVMLVDRGTYSAGSFTALATKAIPHITLMGDTTGGGLGLPNGGQLPNGWIYRFSITQALDLNGVNYENGVPPDVNAYLDWNDLTKDEVIESALQEIL